MTEWQIITILTKVNDNICKIYITSIRTYFASDADWQQVEPEFLMEPEYFNEDTGWVGSLPTK